jgi:outer membrane protein assembly factor BamB
VSSELVVRPQPGRPVDHAWAQLMALIDLGDVSAPARPGPRPRWAGRRWRGVGLALSVAVSLASLHSAPTGEPTVRVVWTAPMPPTVVVQAAQDSVYVLRPVDAGGELTAYDLDTGQVRWVLPTTLATVTAGWFSVLAAAGIVVVPTENGDIAVDAATGRHLWSVAGSVESFTTDSVLLSASGMPGRSARLRLVRSRDGETIWQRSLAEAPAAVVQVRDGRPATVAVDAGGLSLLRYGDGVTLLSRDLQRHGADVQQMVFVGDQLLVHRHYDDRFTVTGYRTDSLAEIWQIETPGDGTVRDCGPVVCLSTSEAVLGLDPGTGARRWAVPEVQDVWPVTGDRVLVAGPRRGPHSDQQPLISVIDARTGRSLGSPTAGQPVVSVSGDRPVLVLRLRDSPVGPTSIYDVDPVTGRSSLIGEVDDALLNLPHELVGRYIVRMREGRLQVMTVG